MSVEERFASHVDFTDDGCWLWTSGRNAKGYGRFTVEGTGRLAHRVSWELFVGQVPAGLQLDHLCRVRHCVNPDHLEPVTPAENTRRGMAGAHCRAKTCCPQGHTYDELNTFVDGHGWRHCRICKADRSRRHKARKRQALKNSA